MQHAKNHGDGANDRRLLGELETIGERSIGLLNLIENTIQSVTADAETAFAIARMTSAFEKRLRAHPPSKRLASSDAVIEKIRGGAGEIAELHGLALSSKARVAEDSRVSDEDGVLEAFDQVIDAFAQAHDALEDLAECLAEIDADFDAPGPTTYANADEMFSALGLK